MIRTLNHCDMEHILNIWLEGNKEAHDFIAGEYWETHLPILRKQLLQAEVYVYETEGAVRGFLGLQGDYIAGIFVEKGFRSMGIGRQLLHHVKKMHPSLSLHVYQKNRRAAAFYLQEGFTVLSGEVDEDTGEMDLTMTWNKKN